MGHSIKIEIESYGNDLDQAELNLIKKYPTDRKFTFGGKRTYGNHELGYKIVQDLFVESQT